MRYLPLQIWHLVAALLFCCLTNKGWAQCVTPPPLTVQNPSFEGTPQPHVTPGPWTNCQPSQTPDTQPGSWGVTLAPTDGSTYLGLVHQVSASWQEGASQQLSSPMQAGTPYVFTVDIANSSATGGGIIPGCAECLIYGSNSACGTDQLLWSSGNITPFDVWNTYNVTFTPTQNWTHIIFYINSLGCTDLPYILVDNMSPITSNQVNADINNTVNVACGGNNSGAATVNAIGQNPPFTFLWSSTPAQTDSVLDNVPAGVYTVTITDAISCSTTATVTLTEPQPIVLTPTINHVTCYGFSTGSAYMSYTGGVPPMNFAWSTGATTQNITGLFAGTYALTVTDANNCSATTSITVTEPSVLSITGTPTSPTCSGMSNGSIVTNTNGGATPYSTYAWSTVPAQTTPNAANIAEGTYSVTVTDNNSCTASVSITVNPPPNALNVSLSPTHVLCYGESTGGIAATVTGGSPGYTYAWSSSPPQTGASLTAVPAGNYTVTVTDAASCSVTVSDVVQQPAAPVSATIGSTDVLCYGQSTGTATVTPSGGLPGYQYLWNTTPPQTTRTAINLPAGAYTCTVTDTVNCTYNLSVNVNQPAGPLQLAISATDVLCYGENTGSMAVVATGGTTGYTYSWSTTPPQTTPSAISLIANNYTVTVTDANSCTASIGGTVNQPPTPVSVTIALSQPICYGQANASAVATATGGTGNHTYLWSTSPPETTPAITNVPAGNYTVTATDANNCTATDNITVAAPPTPVQVTTTPTNVLCYGQSTGSIQALASGSYGNYSYLWSTNPAQTTSLASGLPVGNYSVTVTDIQGCSATAADVITGPAAPLSTTTTQTDVLCYGNNTGGARVYVAGGTPGYQYNWNSTPAQATDTATALVAGTFTVTVTDANNCTITAPVTITQPTAPLAATHQPTNVLCNSLLTGEIDITATGGTTPYSYVWSLTPSANISHATGLPAGTYHATVTDANNCTFTITGMQVTEPPVLTINPQVTDVSCPGHGDGAITTNPNGGTTPYSFSWNTGGNAENPTGMDGGSYTVTVTDANGCSLTDNFTVIELPGVSLSGTAVNVLCFPLTNGSISISATSSFMPLQFSWSHGAVSEDLTGLDTGTYALTITDANGCTADTVFHIGNDSVFSINATPDTSTINLGQSVDLTVTPVGSNIANLVWTPAVGLSCSNCDYTNAAPLESISYFVEAEDVNGCIAYDNVHVTVIPTYTVFIPNAFTPNGDGANDFFEVFGNKEAWKYFHVDVFNRLGELVYSSNNMNFKWDGLYKGSPLPSAVYVYQVNVGYIDNYSEKLFKGSVTLLR